MRYYKDNYCGKLKNQLYAIPKLDRKRGRNKPR